MEGWSIPDGVKIIGFSGQRGSGKSYMASVLEERCGFTNLAFADPLKPLCGALVSGVPLPYANESKTVDISTRVFRAPQERTLTDYLKALEVVKVLSFAVNLTAHEFIRRMKVGMNNYGIETSNCDLNEPGVVRYPQGWTFGKLLQIMGTEVLREGVDEQIWVKNAFHRINLMANAAHPPKSRFVISDVRYLDESETIRRFGGKIIKLRSNVQLGDNHADGRSSQHRSETELERITADLEVFNTMSVEPVVKVLTFVTSYI